MLLTYIHVIIHILIRMPKIFVDVTEESQTARAEITI